MTPLELDIYWHTDETMQLNNLDLPWNTNDLITKKLTFYNIANIQPTDNSDKTIVLGLLVSDGDKYITPYTYQELKDKVDEAHGIINVR